MDDFDIREFAKMFDAALASDNPTVKKALRNFMLVAAIVTAEESDNPKTGPLSSLIEEIRRLSQKVSILETQMYRTTVTSSPSPYETSKYTGNPTWVYQPTTSVSTSSATVRSADLRAEDISDLLRDLRFGNE